MLSVDTRQEQAMVTVGGGFALLVVIIPELLLFILMAVYIVPGISLIQQVILFVLPCGLLYLDLAQLFI